jgi:hypothetical protein
VFLDILDARQGIPLDRGRYGSENSPDAVIDYISFWDVRLS